MKKLLLLSLLFSTLSALALEVSLTWNPVTNSPTLRGYQIYFGYETNAVNNLGPFVSTNSVTVSNLQAVALIHFQLQSVLSNYISSARSSIFTVTNTTPAVPSGITNP